MDQPPVGRLERVQPASVWKSEAGQFLPWLAAPANLGCLGSALGLALEPMGRETQVGHFRADLLCRDRDTGAVVVIEAQLGNSTTVISPDPDLCLRAPGARRRLARFPIPPEHRSVFDRLNACSPWS